jgi:hypothetical protein
MIKPNFILSILGLGVITAGNAVFLGTGPTKTGQIVANEFTGTQAQALEGTCTVTGDAASSHFYREYHRWNSGHWLHALCHSV